MSVSPAGTRFHDLVQRRIEREPGIVIALLEEAVELVLAGELPAARSLIRDTIKRSIGYAELSLRTGVPEKSLVRMFGPNGNPTATHLSEVLRELQRHSRVRLQVTSKPLRRSRTVNRTLRSSASPE